MKILLILALIKELLNPSIGIAENEHYVNFVDGTGYYIENELDLIKGDICLTINGELFVIDNIE